FTWFRPRASTLPSRTMTVPTGRLPSACARAASSRASRMYPSWSTAILRAPRVSANRLGNRGPITRPGASEIGDQHSGLPGDHSGRGQHTLGDGHALTQPATPFGECPLTGNADRLGAGGGARRLHLAHIFAHRPTKDDSIPEGGGVDGQHEVAAG